MSSFANTRGIIILIVGDIVAYFFSLIGTLIIRYGEVPSRELLTIHIPAFSILFLLFLLVSFSAGLYDKQATLIRGRIQGLLIRAQVANVIVGIIFFYVAPVTIAPKANLLIYFILSTILLFVWRLVMYPVVSTGRKQMAILVGDGTDIHDLLNEVNENARYSLTFKEHIIPKSDVSAAVESIRDAVKRTGASIIVADLHNPTIEAAMPFLYSLIFGGVQIIDASKLYEAIFDRIPITIVGERWLVENSATVLGNRITYDTLKRLMDVVISAILGVISLTVYPFVYLAIKMEDKVPLFVMQERIGKDGRRVKFYKFRSMSGNDQGKYGKDGTTAYVVTKVGKFIRNTRIDELPQLWSILRGDMSLVGPRPEFPALVDIYEREIPYYNARHLVKPGVSGWAQIYHQAHPHHAVATEDTKDKLSYDLYYIKNRSLTLDLRIALRTIEILLKRVGR